MIRIYKLISILFHPILLPIVSTILFFILSQTPLDQNSIYRILIIVATATYIIPLFILYLLKKTKLIKSFEVENIQERKIPILFMIVLFYFLGKTLGKIPEIVQLSILFLGSSLSLSICYFLFRKQTKTSIHMIGIGSLLAFLITYSLSQQTNILLIISFLSVLSGIIGHARLYLKAHSLKEVIAGFSIGFMSQIILFIYAFNFSG
tara:strand:+ start:71920 stop:72537 length:618 start_codon:yes stop_codon:yes gene_type:complete